MAAAPPSSRPTGLHQSGLLLSSCCLRRSTALRSSFSSGSSSSNCSPRGVHQDLAAGTRGGPLCSAGGKPAGADAPGFGLSADALRQGGHARCTLHCTAHCNLHCTQCAAQQRRLSADSPNPDAPLWPPNGPKRTLNCRPNDAHFPCGRPSEPEDNFSSPLFAFRPPELAHSAFLQPRGSPLEPSRRSAHSAHSGRPSSSSEFGQLGPSSSSAASQRQAAAGAAAWPRNHNNGSPLANFVHFLASSTLLDAARASATLGATAWLRLVGAELQLDGRCRWRKVRKFGYFVSAAQRPVGRIPRASLRRCGRSPLPLATELRFAVRPPHTSAMGARMERARCCAQAASEAARNGRHTVWSAFGPNLATRKRPCVKGRSLLGAFSTLGRQ